MRTNSQSHTFKSSGKPSQENGGYCDSKRGQNLECDVQTLHMGVMLRRQQTLGHIVYITFDQSLNLYHIQKSQKKKFMSNGHCTSHKNTLDKYLEI